MSNFEVGFDIHHFTPGYLLATTGSYSSRFLNRFPNTLKT
jgi:hypothetical protein